MLKFKKPKFSIGDKVEPLAYKTVNARELYIVEISLCPGEFDTDINDHFTYSTFDSDHGVTTDWKEHELALLQKSEGEDA